MATLNGARINGGFGGVHHTKRNAANSAGAVKPSITTRQFRRMQAKRSKLKQQPSDKGFA